jgi:hypothetical protein
MMFVEQISKDELSILLAKHQGRAPTTLLAALNVKTNPMSAIETAGWGDEIWPAVMGDFGVLAEHRRPISQDDETATRWIERVSWMMAGIAGWTKAEDKQLVMLSALLITADLCGGRQDLWELLPDDFAPSSDFLDIIERYLSQRKIVFAPRGSDAAPIWEREFVEAFQQADKDRDWPTIAKMWPRLEQATYRQGTLANLLACLTRYGFERLVRAVNEIEQIPVTMEIIDALPRRRWLFLALASTSDRLRFCVTMRCGRANSRPDVSPDHLDELTKLLVMVATRSEEWRGWMNAFNTHPSRYPHLHKALGQALAMSSTEAMQIYLESISLQPSPLTTRDEGRLCVSICLRTFDEHASRTHRAIALTKAYQLWDEWGFASDDPECHVTGINRSVLDYAIVRYIEDCMDEAERQTMLSVIRQELSTVDVMWHATDVDCYSEWYRLLSRLQPFAHAVSRQKDRDDALAEQVYYPFDPSKSLYHRIQFHMSDPIRSS